MTGLAFLSIWHKCCQRIVSRLSVQYTSPLYNRPLPGATLASFLSTKSFIFLELSWIFRGGHYIRSSLPICMFCHLKGTHFTRPRYGMINIIEEGCYPPKNVFIRLLVRLISLHTKFQPPSLPRSGRFMVGELWLEKFHEINGLLSLQLELRMELTKVWVMYIIHITGCTNLYKPMGVLAHRLRTLDRSLFPPSAWAEIFWCTCLQSHLQTSPPTPQKSYLKFQNPWTTFDNSPLFA